VFDESQLRFDLHCVSICGSISALRAFVQLKLLALVSEIVEFVHIVIITIVVFHHQLSHQVIILFGCSMNLDLVAVSPHEVHRIPKQIELSMR